MTCNSIMRHSMQLRLGYSCIVTEYSMGPSVDLPTYKYTFQTPLIGRYIRCTYTPAVHELVHTDICHTVHVV